MRPPSSIRRALATGLAALLCLPLTALPSAANAANTANTAGADHVGFG